MKVGDLVWSLAYEPCGKVIVRRMAIIIEVKENYLNPYTIQLVACGSSGVTSRRYLERIG